MLPIQALIEAGENPEDFCFDESNTSEDTKPTRISEKASKIKEEVKEAKSPTAKQPKLESSADNDKEKDGQGDVDELIHLSIGEEEKFIVDEETKESKKAVRDKFGSEKDSEQNNSKTGSQNKNSSPKLKDGEDLKNIWVSGLSPNTVAADLKHEFNKFGQVVSAKVLTNPKVLGAKCYGFILMASKKDADECIKALDGTKLNGYSIKLKAVGDKATSNQKLESLKENDKETTTLNKDNGNQEAEKGSKNGDGKDANVKTGSGNPKENPSKAPHRIRTLHEIRLLNRLRWRERSLRKETIQQNIRRRKLNNFECYLIKEARRLETIQHSIAYERIALQNEREKLRNFEHSLVTRQRSEQQSQNIILEEIRQAKRLIENQAMGPRKRPSVDVNEWQQQSSHADYSSGNQNNRSQSAAGWRTKYEDEKKSEPTVLKSDKFEAQSQAAGGDAVPFKPDVRERGRPFQDRRRFSTAYKGNNAWEANNCFARRPTTRGDTFKTGESRQVDRSTTNNESNWNKWQNNTSTTDKWEDDKVNNSEIKGGSFSRRNYNSNQFNFRQ